MRENAAPVQIEDAGPPDWAEHAKTRERIEAQERDEAQARFARGRVTRYCPGAGASVLLVSGPADLARVQERVTARTVWLRAKRRLRRAGG